MGNGTETCRKIAVAAVLRRQQTEDAAMLDHFQRQATASQQSARTA
jgi:hypothetical protein